MCPLPEPDHLPDTPATSTAAPARSAAPTVPISQLGSGEAHTPGGKPPPGKTQRSDRISRLKSLRATLGALEGKYRQLPDRNAPASAPAPTLAPTPAPTGIASLDARLGGGLPWGGVHELVAARAGDRTAAAGFALALATRLTARPGALHAPFAAPSHGGHFLWVYPRRLAQEAGLPYGPGLMALGHDPGRFTLIEAARPADVLWVVEEALAAAPLTAVFALVDESYEARAFTASRRFALAARTGGTSVFLLGTGMENLASAAPLRWQISPARALLREASGTSRAPGAAPFPCQARWQVRLLRNRFGTVGSWDLQWDHGLGVFCDQTAIVRAPVQSGFDTAPRSGGEDNRKAEQAAAAS